MGTETKTISIGGESIALGSFVKLAGAAGTGGEAKHVVQAGMVKVNGAVEARRGHKVKAGDVVEVEGRGRFVVGH
ncbi:MAG TPA: RNA-binding S4 domain-containing protein [Planctomycetota bacterium]|nr:RNA-binding S4 domain-containing protein [Planctomycetota bacterium]